MWSAIRYRRGQAAVLLALGMATHDAGAAADLDAGVRLDEGRLTLVRR